MAINNIIKELRENKKISMAKIAEALEIPKGTYASYEYGQREPNIEMINKLANYFNVTTDYLLGRETGEPETIEKLVSEFNMTALEKEILEGYLDLPDNLRGDFMEFLQKSVQKIQEEQKGG